MIKKLIKRIFPIFKVYVVYVPERNESIAIDSVWRYRIEAEKRVQWLMDKALFKNVVIIEEEII